jgi:hypothetical protein
MGNASRAVFDSGTVSWKRSKDTVVLDAENLLASQPDLLQRFPMNRPGSRRFLISV